MRGRLGDPLGRARSDPLVRADDRERVQLAEVVLVVGLDPEDTSSSIGTTFSGSSAIRAALPGQVDEQRLVARVDQLGDVRQERRAVEARPGVEKDDGWPLAEIADV